MLLCNKKALESKYYIWDMECSTEDAMWREVSEHKPIFVTACNMANTTDRIEFYGKDCLDQFLTLILQDQKYKKRTFIAHNAGGYDCQFVMRWIEQGQHYTLTNIRFNSHMMEFDSSIHGTLSRFPYPS
jgi:hypothetical protein